MPRSIVKFIPPFLEVTLRPCWLVTLCQVCMNKCTSNSISIRLSTGDPQPPPLSSIQTYLRQPCAHIPEQPDIQNCGIQFFLDSSANAIKIKYRLLIFFGQNKNFWVRMSNITNRVSACCLIESPDRTPFHITYSNNKHSVTMPA